MLVHEQITGFDVPIGAFALDRDTPIHTLSQGTLIMPNRTGKAVLYLLIAYWIVTILGILLTILFDVLFHPPTPEELGVPVTQAPAYLMTLPFHPLLNLIVWPFFALWYLRGLAPKVPRFQEAFRLGAFWALITIIVDLIGWVLVPHVWQMTLNEFYVDYQPWITLIYLIIFLTPVVVALLMKTEQKSVPA